MTNIILDRVDISTPKKTDENFDQEWHDFSRIILSAYMEVPWFVRVFPNAIERRDYLERYVSDFHDNCMMKDGGGFVALKLRGSRYNIFGGITANWKVTPSYIKNPRNLDEIRLNYMNKHIIEPLKAVTAKYNAGLWYIGLWAIEPPLSGIQIGQVIKKRSTQLLMRVMEWIQNQGTTLSYPPLVITVLLHEFGRDALINRKQGFVDIGSVTYTDKAFGQVTDYIGVIKLPGTKDMLQEARSCFKQAAVVSKL